MVRCYICGSDFQVQARHLEYKCQVVTLCRLCALKSITDVIFKCACGKYDFLAKYPHRMRILAMRLHLPLDTEEYMANGLAIVESASCKVCKSKVEKTATTGENTPD